VIIAVCVFFILRPKQNTSAYLHREYHLSSADLLRGSYLSLGSASATEKIVAFSDYQCPYCRREWSVLKTLSTHNNGVAVYIRQFPLTQIHQFAMPASLAAVESGRHGTFAAMSDLLFSGKLSEDSIHEYLLSLGVTRSDERNLVAEAKTQVRDDLVLGERLGVTSTPTMFLINGKSDVYRVTNYNVLQILLR
jgi:protein-disulfide isomerase